MKFSRGDLLTAAHSGLYERWLNLKGRPAKSASAILKYFLCLSLRLCSIDHCNAITAGKASLPNSQTEMASLSSLCTNQPLFNVKKIRKKENSSRRNFFFFFNFRLGGAFLVFLTYTAREHPRHFRAVREKRKEIHPLSPFICQALFTPLKDGNSQFCTHFKYQNKPQFGDSE